MFVASGGSILESKKRGLCEGKFHLQVRVEYDGYSAPNTGLIARGDQLTTPPGIASDVWLVTYNDLYHNTTSDWNGWTKTHA